MPIDESKLQHAIQICESHGVKVEMNSLYASVTFPDGKAGNVTHSLLIEYGKKIEYHDKRKEVKKL